MMSAKAGPVVLIGIDAADLTVVEQLLSDGQLPNIAALRRRGAWARLRNEPPGFLSLVWPSFFNGTRARRSMAGITARCGARRTSGSNMPTMTGCRSTRSGTI